MRPALILASLAFLLSGPSLGAAPVIGFEQKGVVVVSGVTPGGRVACYGVAHDWVDFYRGIYRWGREAVDDDRDGSVTVELPREVPVRSVWACVDIATGAVAIAAPDDSPRKEVALRGRGSLLGAHGDRQFQVESERVDLLLARPGEGAWLQLAGDGATNDDDRAADGAVHARAAGFKGIGAVKAVAASLQGACTIVAFYPLTLEYSVVALGKAE